MKKSRFFVMISIITAGFISPISPTQGKEAVERYLVRYEADHHNAIMAALQKKRISILRRMKQHPISTRMTASQAQWLLSHPGVHAVEKEARRYPMDLPPDTSGNETIHYPLFPRATPVQDSTAPAQMESIALEQTQVAKIPKTYATAKSICIIDSGYDLNHEDLPTDNISGTNNPGSGNWYEDETGHGTHVAGTILALDNNIGVVGVIPNGGIRVHVVKVFGENQPADSEDNEESEDNWAYSGDLVAALEVCESMGTDIVNMSLGGEGAIDAERIAFAHAYDAGILLVAAAGNDGPTGEPIYPASYDSVISVTAVDDNNQIAEFSQVNRNIELAAPGVAILSTIPMGTGTAAYISEAGNATDKFIRAEAMEGSSFAEITADLYDCDQAFDICAGAQGKICLITRGENTFAEKALNCQNANGTGTIIINNVEGILLGTLGETEIDIPVVGISLIQGEQLENLPDEAVISLGVISTNYERQGGTSMATPFVSGIAALVWSYHPQCDARDIRRVLELTALDLGDWRKDPIFGYGLVQALKAKSRLDLRGCGTLPFRQVHDISNVIE